MVMTSYIVTYPQVDIGKSSIGGDLDQSSGNGVGIGGNHGEGWVEER